MLRYYSGKACNYREISPPLEEFLMPFVLRSRQEVQRERQAVSCKGRAPIADIVATQAPTYHAGGVRQAQGGIEA